MSQEPIILSSYGALDSDCLADGRPSDAHLLRTLAGSSNRLITRGQPLVQCIYSAVPESILGSAFPGLGFEYPGLHKLYASTVWTKITIDIPVIKKPLIRTAKLFARLGASNDALLSIQVATEAAPFDPSAKVEASENIYTFSGSATDPYGDVSFAMFGIPLREGPTETVSFYVRANSLGDLGNETTNGGDNTDTIERISDSGLVIKGDSTGGWNDYSNANNWAVNGHGVLISSGGVPVTEPRWITKVLSSDEIRVWPPLPSADVTGELRGATMEIRKLATVRIYGLTLYGY